MAKFRQIMSLSLIIGFVLPCLSYAASNVDQIRKQAGKCSENADYTCAEKKWREFVKLMPNDEAGRFNLAVALTHRQKHKEAISIYEQLIDEGVGTWDLFVNYSASLKANGDEDKAIAWQYRTLAVLPSLVDVRADLAKLLLKKNRGYEALSLLVSFDDYLISKGKTAYFVGQRIAIAEAIGRREKTDQKSIAVLSHRVPKFESHFYTVVSANSADVPILTLIFVHYNLVAEDLLISVYLFESFLRQQVFRI